MLETIVKGLAGRLLAYGIFGLGFWVLYRSMFQPSLLTGIPMGVLGGALILGGMYLIVSVRRFTGRRQDDAPEEGPTGESEIHQEDDRGDTINGRCQGR
jgi:hypothetical protein